MPFLFYLDIETKIPTIFFLSKPTNCSSCKSNRITRFSRACLCEGDDCDCVVYASWETSDAVGWLSDSYLMCCSTTADGPFQSVIGNETCIVKWLIPINHQLIWVITLFFLYVYFFRGLKNNRYNNSLSFKSNNIPLILVLERFLSNMIFLFI